MADLQNRSDVVDVEATIARLRGVVSARIATDERGAISEIHVVGDLNRHPKQLSRDIESALFSELGIRVDHRKISIAQIRTPTEAPTDMRLKFLTIDYSVDRTTARARVSVGRGDSTFTGVASTAVGRELDQEQLIARASLLAIEEFLRSVSLTNGTPTLELRDFSRSEGNGSPFVMVAVRILGGRGEEDLLGSAIVRDDSWRAAAYATLDAVNRRLAGLCSELGGPASGFAQNS